MPAKVFDSYALIAYFRDEKGSDTVEQLLVTASRKDSPILMTDVNYAEVKYSIIRKDGAARWRDVAELIKMLPIEFHPTSRALADLAADFKTRNRMSLADAFAAALAKERKAELVTGDLEFKGIESEIRLLWI